MTTEYSVNTWICDSCEVKHPVIEPAVCTGCAGTNFTIDGTCSKGSVLSDVEIEALELGAEDEAAMKATAATDRQQFIDAAPD